MAMTGRSRFIRAKSCERCTLDGMTTKVQLLAFDLLELDARICAGCGRGAQGAA
jgi:hypothetical protein